MKTCEISVKCVRLTKQEKEKSEYEITNVSWLEEYLLNIE